MPLSQIIGVLAVNLVPAICVLVLGWGALTLLLLYWIENLIVGAFNVFKILAAGSMLGRLGVLYTLFIVPFFVFHYGMFCYVHGIFIFVLFGGGLADNAPSPSGHLVGLVLDRVQNDSFLFWNVLLLGAYHLYLFLRWLAEARWKNSEPFTQMFAPYARIIVVHLTIMIAGIPVLLLGQPIFAVFCLALLKTGLETGRMRMFGAFAENPALAEKMRATLKALGDQAPH